MVMWIDDRPALDLRCKPQKAVLYWLEKGDREEGKGEVVLAGRLSTS